MKPGFEAGRIVALVPRSRSRIVLAARASAASDYDLGAIHISQPWARATPKGATAGAGYMTITNKGATPDKIICISDDASTQCQIHTMTMEGGVMKMRPVEGGLEIKPGESVTLKPGGDHVMLLGLNGPLREGQSFPLTLTFEKAGTRDVTVVVEKPGASGPPPQR